MSKYLRWKSFEREIVSDFKNLGYKEAKRNFGEQFEKKSGVDILNVEPFIVQVGYGKTQSLLTKFKEALGEAKAGRIPMAVVRRTVGGKKPLTCVVLNWEDFKRILEKWQK